MLTLPLRPYLRLSIGLIVLTLSILLIGESLGIVPDKSQIILDHRKKLTEILAEQYALGAEKKDLSQIEAALNALVKKNSEVLSAAIRQSDGTFYAMAGDHQAIWQTPDVGNPSLTYIQVPILQDNKTWGTVELSFAPFDSNDFSNIVKNSFWGLLLFVACSGFLAYLLMLKRALKELDSSAVISPRVKAAFDTLTEGILILDEQGRIVLANSAFCDKFGLAFDSLMGKEASNLGWEKSSIEQLKEDWQYPWIESFRNKKTLTRIRLNFNAGDDSKSVFMVNSAPILGENNQCKGALVTFDDVTEIEDSNIKLDMMLKRLELSRNEISRQNSELKKLAEIDPLTGFYNRRALNIYFNEVFNQTCEQSTDLVCIMLDIDRFKSINDTYGHQTGDEVIKLVAAITKENLRDTDIVGRYGGEEFCLVLPRLELEAVLRIAERIRINIMDSTGYHAYGVERVTISLGVSTLADGVQNPNEMIDLADKALYFAKNNGRNRVAVWREIFQDNVGVVVTENTATDQNDMVIASNDAVITDVHQLHAKIRELEQLTEKQHKIIAHRLNFDAATGLPNRMELHSRLKTAISYAARSNSYVAVLSLSLSSYKRIHSTLGYEAAEKLIIEISHRVSSILRTTDTISSDIGVSNFDSILSRKNDNGFYILLSELKRDQSITWIINRVYAALNQTLIIEDLNIQTESAIGVSMYPIDGHNPETLLDFADQALHNAESQGKGSCQFYSNKMDNEYLAQIKIESGLIRAIERLEFEIFYQPIVNMQHGMITRLEALLRWNHPDKEIFAAMSFIDVAEQSGLIVQIGDWVLREAIRQLAIWRREISPEIQISVNISSVQLHQTDLAEKILGYLQDYRVPAENLVLEITESMIMQSIENATRILGHLHDRGIKIALDDFGMGYSSLQYLQKFPIDFIKIDRSFITDIAANNCNDNIVLGVIAMSKNMGFMTIAEGVETEEQFKHLYKLGCDEVQGYLTGFPIPKEQMHKVLEQQKLTMHIKSVAVNQ